MSCQEKVNQALGDKPYDNWEATEMLCKTIAICMDELIEAIKAQIDESVKDIILCLNRNNQ